MRRRVFCLYQGEVAEGVASRLVAALEEDARRFGVDLQARMIDDQTADVRERIHDTIGQELNQADFAVFILAHDPRPISQGGNLWEELGRVMASDSIGSFKQILYKGVHPETVRIPSNLAGQVWSECKTHEEVQNCVWRFLYSNSKASPQDVHVFVNKDELEDYTTVLKCLGDDGVRLKLIESTESFPTLGAEGDLGGIHSGDACVAFVSDAGFGDGSREQLATDLYLPAVLGAWVQTKRASRFLVLSKRSGEDASPRLQGLLRGYEGLGVRTGRRPGAELSEILALLLGLSDKRRGEASEVTPVGGKHCIKQTMLPHWTDAAQLEDMQAICFRHEKQDCSSSFDLTRFCAELMRMGRSNMELNGVARYLDRIGTHSRRLFELLKLYRQHPGEDWQTLTTEGLHALNAHHQLLGAIRELKGFAEEYLARGSYPAEVEAESEQGKLGNEAQTEADVRFQDPWMRIERFLLHRVCKLDQYEPRGHHQTLVLPQNIADRIPTFLARIREWELGLRQDVALGKALEIIQRGNRIQEQDRPVLNQASDECYEFAQVAQTAAHALNLMFDEYFRECRTVLKQQFSEVRGIQDMHPKIERILESLPHYTDNRRFPTLWRNQAGAKPMSVGEMVEA